MKKLTKLTYLIIALVMIASCEKSNDIEGIQEPQTVKAFLNLEIGQSAEDVTRVKSNTRSNKENQVAKVSGPIECPEFDIAGPYCAPCDDPSGGSALACSAGMNSVIQGIDLTGAPKMVKVNSIDFNQESNGGASTIDVNLFCAPAGGPVPYAAVDTPFYTETFTIIPGDDGSCVTLTFTTPPTLDTSCDTMWIEIVTLTGRAVSTPPACDGNSGTGLNSWIWAPGCGLTTPTSFDITGFAHLDVGYNASFECIDSDNDGCFDDEDAHIYSDLSENISIGDCDPEIKNEFSACGTTMMDEINDLIAEVSAEAQKPRRRWERPYDSERAFKRGMSGLTVKWVSNSLITWPESFVIFNCSVNSNIDFEGNNPG